MGLRRTDPPPARTDEERRRAREERERRRGRVAPPPPELAATEPPEVQPPAEGAPPPEEQAPPPDEVAPAVLPEPGPPTEQAPPPVEQPPAPLPQPPMEQPSAPPPEPPVGQAPLQPDVPLTLLRAPALRSGARRSLGHRPHVHRPHLHRPQLHRPHLHRPRVPRGRSLPARLGALGALVAVLALVGVGALALERSRRHKPIEPLATTRIVIPEGSTATQIAEIARAHHLSGDYLKAAAAARQLSPAHYGAPAHERSLEGFLFPATYELYAGASAATLVAKQLAAFDESFSATDAARAKALGITPYQLLIVASMVEREASLSRERPLVAAVIYNRLRRNMPLGIDATLRYALHNDYTHPLTEAELHSSSPYNTRTHAGLPPTPISNPGLASIEAAANPARVSFLYYVARADGCPGQVFSSSYAQFEHDAAAYQEALSANHGRVPTCHKA